MYVIGAGDCGQLGVGEDDVEALRARLSSVASGMKVHTTLVLRPVQADTGVLYCVRTTPSLACKQHCVQCGPPNAGAGISPDKASPT